MSSDTFPIHGVPTAKSVLEMIKNAGEVEFTFADTDEGRANASAARALLMMKGFTPEAIGFTAGASYTQDIAEREAQIQEGIAQAFNPHLKIKGMTGTEFETFHREWLADGGNVSKLQEKENKRGMHPIPTIRITSKALPVAAFRFTLDAATSPHAQTMKGLKGYGFPVVDNVMSKTEGHYIDVAATPGTDYLPNLLLYLATPTPTLRINPTVTAGAAYRGRT